MLQDAAFVSSRSVALQLDRHLDFDSLVSRDAGEIDVQDFEAEGIPLQFSNQRTIAYAAAKIDKPRMSANRVCQLLSADSQRNRFLAVTIEHRGHLSLTAKAAGLACAPFGANFDVQYFCHDDPWTKGFGCGDLTRRKLKRLCGL